MTKLRIPALRQRAIPRTRLLDRLALDPSTKLFLISAPAGYGKTTLLSQWSHALVESGTAVAWYAIDSSDDDPIPFGSYLVASLDQALGPASELAPVAQRLRSSPDIDLRHVLPAILNSLNSTNRGCVLILDDYHLISSPAIHSAMAFLLERVPETMHVVIGSRADPPLPLARLRARGQMLELRSSQLRCTAEETEQFLNEVMQLGLSPDSIAGLEARTEGWIAGLQLAALSLSGRTDSSSFISSYAGSNRYLIEYLLQEVVGRQPEHVQAFLLYTSILERLCAPLCDTILGDHSRSETILQGLQDSNLFLVPLDDQGCWYRYHHLFRDFLQARLNKTASERVASLHRSASEWCAGQGLLREAVRHALQTRDWTFAADLVERHGMPMLMHSEISTVYGWCAAFPEHVLQTRALLCILQGWTLVLGYRRDNCSRVEERLQMAERAASVLEDRQQGRWLEGQAAVVRTFIANAPNPEADPREQLVLAQRALDLLPPGDPLRSTTTLTVGYAHMALQDPQAACQALEEARQLSLAGQNYYGAVEATFQLARIAHTQGLLRRASEICQQGRASITTVVARVEQELPAIGSLDIALGSVLLEQNKLADAEHALVHGLDLLGWDINPDYQMTACVSLFRLREVQGRSPEALQFLDRLEETWSDIRFLTQGLRVVHALRTAPDDPATRAAATSWCQDSISSLGENVPLPGIGPLGAAQAFYLARLAWARAQIALGCPQLALPYLERQIEMARSHRLDHRLIELSLAEAQAQHAGGENERTWEALERGLVLAEPEGYIRIFDQNPAFSRLLAEAAQRGIQRDYVRHILQSIGTPVDTLIEKAGSRTSFDTMSHPGNEQAEILSGRELEVLGLMARGASNQEIADALVITLGTVKSHINHITVKLDVHNRTQAVARARELGLIRI